ncbi:MAG: hypothetical protein ABSG38_04605 [Spirochaetia bacterium]|jgi:hypothetical protein
MFRRSRSVDLVYQGATVNGIEEDNLVVENAERQKLGSDRLSVPRGNHNEIVGNLVGSGRWEDLETFNAAVLKGRIIIPEAEEVSTRATGTEN